MVYDAMVHTHFKWGRTTVNFKNIAMPLKSLLNTFIFSIFATDMISLATKYSFLIGQFRHWSFCKMNLNIIQATSSFHRKEIFKRLAQHHVGHEHRTWDFRVGILTQGWWFDVDSYKLLIFIIASHVKMSEQYIMFCMVPKAVSKPCVEQLSDKCLIMNVRGFVVWVFL